MSVAICLESPSGLLQWPFECSQFELELSRALTAKVNLETRDPNK